MTSQMTLCAELLKFYNEKNRWPCLVTSNPMEKRLAVFHGMCKLKEFKYDKLVLKDARRKLNESEVPWKSFGSLRGILCQEKRERIAKNLLVFFLTYNRWPRVNLNMDAEEKELGIYLAHMRIAERKKSGMYKLERHILDDFGIPWVNNSFNKINMEMFEVEQ